MTINPIPFEKIIPGDVVYIRYNTSSAGLYAYLIRVVAVNPRTIRGAFVYHIQNSSFLPSSEESSVCGFSDGLGMLFFLLKRE